MASEVKVIIVGDSTSAQKALRDLDRTSSTTTSNFDKVGSRMQSVGQRMSNVGMTLTKTVTPALLAMGFVAVNEFSEVEKVNAQTAAALKSTGGAANVTAGHIRGLAARMGELAAKDAEEVQAAENVLLTFTKVQNKVGEGNAIFDRATLSIMNMSARLGTDLQSSSILVGKALNDPIKGLTALTRVGVSFTDGQRAMIEKMVESGNTMGAQKVILAELQKEFGGSAKAAGEAASPFEKLTLAFNDMAESLGEILMPFVQQLADWFTVLADKFQDLSPEMKKTIVVIGGIVAALGPVLVIVGKFISGLGLLVSNIGNVIKIFNALRVAMLANPFLAIAAATIAIATLIVLNWDKIRDFLIKVWDRIKEVARNVWDAVPGFIKDGLGRAKDIVMAVMDIIKGDWGKAWDRIKDVLKSSWDSMKQLVRNAAEAVKTAVMNQWNRVREVFSNAWSRAREIVGNAWDRIKEVVNNGTDRVMEFVKSLPERIVNALKSLPGKMLSIGKNIVMGLINGIKSMIGSIMGVVDSIADSITDKFKDALDIFSPSKVFEGFGRNIMQGLQNGLRGSLGGLNATMDVVTKTVTPGGSATSAVGAGGTGANIHVDGRAFARLILPHLVQEIRTSTGVKSF